LRRREQVRRARPNLGSNPANLSKPKKLSPMDLFFLAWLGQIKQTLTIYKEDIRNRLEEYNPEK
jgi:hypothetical protein